MQNVKRLLQINLFVAVLVSGTLLGIAMESPRMIAVSVVGAALGFITTDLLKLFHLRGVIANVASILILFLAMKDFFSLDGTGKLVSVANLLVYLQTVLMFQEKTPRLNWQVMVLTLLQVVVSAIFSLDLEGGLLLLTYFLVVGSAMFLQSIYLQQFEIERTNFAASKRAFSALGWQAGRSTASDDADAANATAVSRATISGAPVTFFDYKSQPPLKLSSIGMQLVLWAGVTFAFTMVLFYLAPRHAPPWYGPLSTQVTTAGVSKSVDLDERGIIELSNQIMFRARFRSANGSALNLRGTPYFRGLALSDLVVKNGMTDWRAPQDRVSDEHYQAIPSVFLSEPVGGQPVLQSFKMEETEDPLVYGVFPFYRSESTPKKMQFCHEISGLTRCRLRESIDMAPFKYQAATWIDDQGRFARAWPYVSNTGPYVQRPMSEDKPQMAWLTKLHPDLRRYDAICKLSDQIASDNKSDGGTKIDLFRKMESYLRSGGGFRYTLDFRKIKRDESLDPVEDFVLNHRTGHCELYASALTIMLRRQGIPARLVVGFRGGSYDQSTNGYTVRANNAHAWVEAYLPKEDCTEEMFRTGQAGDGGAWMILESTPLANADNAGEEAMDIARSVWDDYVLGRDNEQDGADYSSGVFGWLRGLDVNAIDRQIKNVTSLLKQPWVKYGIPAVIFMVFVFFVIRNSSREDDENSTGEKVGFLRRVVANAISLISPQLSKWVMGRGDTVRVDFYERLVGMLEQHQLVRSPNQTHREFAEVVAHRFADHEQADLIGSHIKNLTESFNEIRFGGSRVGEDQAGDIATRLVELEAAIKPV